MRRVRRTRTVRAAVRPGPATPRGRRTDRDSRAFRQIPDHLFLEGAPRGTPTVIDGTVYFVRPDGTVTAVNASNGARLWQRDAQIENLSAPAHSTAYGTVYFANRYGRLIALDQDTGAVRWTTAKLDDPGTSAENTIPSVLLVKDTVVAVAGETAFSVHPDQD
ncbi:outer membrane protein assembly factor BamB family protein [Streptomyces sp. NBC_00457]|uniref:outer membrane protein assembly factor BamB family protein n=1 Tax=Streptomyces sp. NBC_00457 TaxID=2975748 RepID=UPI002E201657